MNERAKELAAQAKIWAMANTTYPISSHIPPGYTRHLIELIVKECANVAADHDAMDIYEEIREHFGIEQ